ncbi:epoxyqueuosine reductase [Clostridia bacterium]|nr:epoxyqueuosine reductase [Clostridia bacterium]
MGVSFREAIRLAQDAGFARAALTDAAPLTGYVPNDQARGIEADPRALLPGARSVLVAAMPFAWHSAWPEGYAEVSAFYFWSQRAHEAIRALEGALTARGARVDARQNIPQKPLGVRAGFGVIGRNALLRNDAWGSCFTLRTLVTDIEPGEVSAMPAAPCGDCRKCVDACPTGALGGAGDLDTARCVRAYMMTGDVVPEPLRAAMGTRLLGCEGCQRACPHNAHIAAVPPEPAPFAMAALLRGDRRDLDEVAARIGWNEARLQRVQAQAALAAGNSGDAQFLPALRALAQSDRPVVARHASWAAERIAEHLR